MPEINQPALFCEDDEQPSVAAVARASAQVTTRGLIEAAASPKVPGLRAKGGELAAGITELPKAGNPGTVRRRCRAVAEGLEPVLSMIDAPSAMLADSSEFCWLRDNVRVLTHALEDLAELPRSVERIPWVRDLNGAELPRVLAIAEDLVPALGARFNSEALGTYLDGFQESTPLKMNELWLLISALKLIFLEEIVKRSSRLAADPEGVYGISVCVRSLREMGQADWEEILEPMVLFDRVLRQDPAGAYAQMDFASRDYYRKVVCEIAEHSGMSEIDVAREALWLAREARRKDYDDPRLAARRSHVGYYLVAEGVEVLRRRTGYHPSLSQRLRRWVRRRPSMYYVGSILLLTATLVGLLLALAPHFSGWLEMAAAALALLLPCSQVAVELANFFTSRLLSPQVLPKLDFSEGLPRHCTTLVVVPTLLLNEAQVRKLASNLEIQYLGNHDPNMHFALLTDLPDSPQPGGEDDPLVDLCRELIEELNVKYGPRREGSFFMLHRHRVYNPGESVWMGWERKRGKLLDLNKLLRGEYDSFPVKAGDIGCLKEVRFVITLDSDTELPRGSAHRLVGALAHPLNQAIIDHESNTVKAGYGILQPRIAVSVHSAARSRFAAIYSGHTGLDLYTQAVSDVYQDLFGEGIFTGKGIYEVGTFHKVLDGRLPQNALLSHDLIEGVYARAGLVSDIQLIDEYPSRYSAYNRRKHRWVRGDWQIAEWLLPHVPQGDGRRAANPLSFISRWKIFDNLRRSLVEPAIFLLMLLGWLVFPGADYWTLAAVGLLLLPAAVQFALRLAQGVVDGKVSVLKGAFAGLASASVYTFFMLGFLLGQALLSVDAIGRSLVRRLVTHRRMLEWETAAEAESGLRGRTHLDGYLDWSPVITAGIGLVIARIHPQASSAIPLLTLWGASPLLARILGQPARAAGKELSEKDKRLLRSIALRTWRFFATHSTEEHNWLVPDTVQQSPACVVPKISPTNMGMLLNARQVACELGYLTTAEFAQQTRRTLETILRLPRHRGHLLNWYDTRNLRPLPPYFVSSVDSGNLVASLWTLQQGCLEQLRQPVLTRHLAEGWIDHLRLALGNQRPNARLLELERKLTGDHWMEHLLTLPDSIVDEVCPAAAASASEDVAWFKAQAAERLRQVRQFVEQHAPWLLPDFAALRQGPELQLDSATAFELEQLPAFIDALAIRLRAGLKDSRLSAERESLYRKLLAALGPASQHATELIGQLRMIAYKAGLLAQNMDFSFLLNERNKMLSIGYEIDARRLHSACYDLLASEARIAAFVAIAKEHIPQETWFLLGRSTTFHKGQPVLLSWTGTMFEYLMPSLWMRTYPNTLLDRSLVTAVRVQQAYTARKRVPWGISESAFFTLNDSGHYGYTAFGVPGLAVHKGEREALVISPYSTLLALGADPAAALKNLRTMISLGWMGSYGFYESADYSSARGGRRKHAEIVPCWMAHHQGMGLLAIANCLHDGVVQRWFHANPSVQATELLLHEKPVTHGALTARRGTAAA